MSIHIPANYPYQVHQKSSSSVKSSLAGKQLLESARNGNLEGVKRALEKGADISEKKVGLSSLHYAVCYNHFDIVKYLVEYGADVNDKNLSGTTPLICAIDNGNCKIAEYLLEWDAEIDLRDCKGNSAFHKAVMKGDKSTIELLIAWKANINSINLEHLSPLHECISRDHFDIAKRLIEKKVDVNAETKHKTTCLHKIINKKNNIEYAKLLLDNNADPNHKDSSGKTPLHIAVVSKKKELIEILLKYKSDCLIRDNNNNTAYGIAQRLNNEEIINLFNQID